MADRETTFYYHARLSELEVVQGGPELMADVRAQGAKILKARLADDGWTQDGPIEWKMTRCARSNETELRASVNARKSGTFKALMLNGPLDTKEMELALGTETFNVPVAPEVDLGGPFIPVIRTAKYRHVGDLPNGVALFDCR